LLALLGSAGACKSDPRFDVDGVEHTRPSALAEQVREAGIGEAGIVLTSAAPDDFPPTLRLYPGARVTLGGKEPTPTGRRSWTLTVETADSKDQVRAFYRANLPGFTAASDIDLGDSALSVWRSDAFDLELVVGKGADGKTTVTLDVAER
jgi:hypothetical protein